MLDQDKLTLEYPDRGQRRVLALQNYPVVWAFVESIRSTLAGDYQTLNRFYRASVAGSEEQWRLSLKPVEPKMQSVVQEIRIGGSHNRLRTIEITRDAGRPLGHDDHRGRLMTLALSSRWAIALWVGALAGCAIVITRTEFTADMSAFLPRSPTPVQQILVQQLRDGVVSRLILIAIDGGSPAALAQTSMRLAAELRKHQAEFTAVNNGEDGALDQDREFLWRNRYLLSPAVAPGHFSARRAARCARGGPATASVRRPARCCDESCRKIPPANCCTSSAQFEGVARPEVREGVWFSPDGSRALLVAQTRAAGYDIDAQERALDPIRAAFAAARCGQRVPQNLLVSGPGVFSVNSRARIKADALRFSVIATALVAGLLLALYRSPRVLLLGLVPVASGVLAGVAAVSIGFGTVHGITLGFGVTLIGEAVDYAIYLFTQITPGTTPADSLARIWPTLRLGLLTSICGFGGHAAVRLSGIGPARAFFHRRA